MTQIVQKSRRTLPKHTIFSPPVTSKLLSIALVPYQKPRVSLRQLKLRLLLSEALDGLAREEAHAQRVLEAVVQAPGRRSRAYPAASGRAAAGIAACP